jgi:rare lipoprotein A
LLLERLLPADIERMAENRKNNPVVVASAPQSAPPVAVAAVAAVVSVPVVIATAPFVTPLPPSVPVQSTFTATQSGPALDALIAEKTAAESDSERAASANVVAPTGAAPTSTPAPIPAVTTNPNPASGYYLQFGAFGLRSNAEATFAHLQSKLAQLPDFEIVQQGTLYRLFSGPFASREEANDAVQMAVNVGVPKPIIIQR